MDMLCPLARDKNTWVPFYIMGGLLILYKYRWVGLWMIVCTALTVLVSDQSSDLIKHFIHRLRPCAVENVRLLVDHCSDTFSFTSNHAANHFAIAVFLSLALRQYRWLAIILILWASFISLSQVYVGLHYPADIAGGGLLGSLVGYGTFLLFGSIRKRFL
jgi:membrane-associated phospholipid phosphatase